MFSAMRQLASQSGEVFDDFDTVRAWMVEHDDCTGRVGVIGFCLGGGFALMLASTSTYSAARVNYGGVPEDALAVLASSCPIVASYGERDRSLNGAPELLRQALEDNQIPHDVKTYPAAGHGFMNNHPPEEMPIWASVSGKFAATGYHEQSTIDARNRISGFFNTHLTPSA